VIDLEGLAEVVDLPGDSAAPLIHRAAVALERRHRPGVRLSGDLQDVPIDEELRWRERGLGIAPYEDVTKATEEGAEALALALAGALRSWRVVRRLQQQHREGADWLMLDITTGNRVILEVGGTDEQNLATLLQRKLDQARGSPFAASATPAACVVRFLEPSAKLWADDDSRRPEP
jgi:hypothetical protein